MPDGIRNDFYAETQVAKLAAAGARTEGLADPNNRLGARTAPISLQNLRRIVFKMIKELPHDSVKRFSLGGQPQRSAHDARIRDATARGNARPDDPIPYHRRT